MYNTKLPPASARPSLAYSGRPVELASPWSETTPLPRFNAWVHRNGRVVLHRSTGGNAREVVVAVVINSVAWRVDSGTAKQAKALALRVEAAVESLPDVWTALDATRRGMHPESSRWPEVLQAFDRHDARSVKES